MAAASQAHAVKCLNTGPSGKRFVFKSFSQRVEEIDIDVFRSLQPVNSEPSEGSSFFRDALLYWRELNTAEDFISFYEEAMPIVQTLPQILLHKKRIISALLCRVQMKARLSLEPILGLIATLSRDILEEFILFLPRFVDSLLLLLQSGGEHDPEVLEQVFTSLSYLIMYLQKYLVNDVTQVLKVTSRLRYYPKDHVQEYMAEAISFLMRNAPANQLNKGVLKILTEVSKNSSAVRKSGAVALLWHILRGTSSTLHSKAEQVLRLLVSEPVLSIQDNSCQGSETSVVVICGVLQRLCKELGQKELNLFWDILLDKIRTACCTDECLLHMNHLLSILISTVRFSNGSRTCNYIPILDLVNLLIENFVMAPRNIGLLDQQARVIDNILQLILCLLDVPSICDNPSKLSSISLQWAPVFKYGGSSLVTFIKQLVLKESHVTHAFRIHILSAMDSLVDSSPEEVLYLMLTFYDRQDTSQYPDALNCASEATVSRISNFFIEELCKWTNLINSIATKRENSDTQVRESELAVLWGVLRCYCHIHDQSRNHLFVKDIVDALNKLVATEAESIAGLPKSTWQGIFGAALTLYHKLILGSEIIFSEISYFLHIAKGNKSSVHLLCSVADFLDSVLGINNEAVEGKKLPVLDEDQAVDAISTFADSLALSDKAIRIATLRILSHYANLNCQLTPGDDRPHKKLRTDGSSLCSEDMQCNNVIQLLLSIETTPVSVSTSRKIIILISRIEMGLRAAKISDAYLPLLAHAIVGIFHNRFSHLWEPSMECFTILIGKYKELVWDRYVQYLENYQSYFLCTDSHSEIMDSNYLNRTDLGNCFNSYLASESDSTPRATVLGLLLQSLQKVHDVAESRSRQLVPLFMKFMGYADDNTTSVLSFSAHQCNGKEWKIVVLEWLKLLKLMRNSRSIYQNQFVKDVLIDRLLDETDSDIQFKVLDCLLNWRDDFLLPYEGHLKNLINSKNIREELTTWSLSKDSLCIQEDHRRYLIPLIIRLLVAKVRKLKTLASRKHAGANQRKAVLCFLAQLDVDELPLFFSLLLKHLFSNHLGYEFPDIEFGKLLGVLQSPKLVEFSTSMKIDNLSLKKCFGFLHVVEDVLKTFDESRVKPFLKPITLIVVRILERSSSNLASNKDNEDHSRGDDSSGDAKSHELDDLVQNPLTPTAVKQFKDLRSLCLRIISFVLDKYQDYDLDVEFWETFFSSTKPLIDTFKQEGSSSEKPSSLLSCFVAMSRSTKFVSLLDREVNLVPNIFSILTVRSTSDAVLSSVLMFIENLLSLDHDLDQEESNPVKSVLVPHIETLILSLSGLFQIRKQSNRKAMVGPGKTEIGILKLLAKYVREPLASQYFVEIMLPLFKKKTFKSDECIEGLHVIKGILPVMDNTTIGEVLRMAHSLLVSAELSIRLCICDILDLLSEKDSSLVFLAKLLRDLNASSSSELGELDYDARLNAYNKIKPQIFYELKELLALVILSHCVYDISSDDLIIRQSASSSLLSFIEFARTTLDRESENCSGTVPDCSSLKGTAAGGFWTKTSVLFVIKKVFLRNMGHAMVKEISVQKEWISLLREMVFKLPRMTSLGSLKPLCSDDPEEDFFNNILHLQIHKRVKALSRFRCVISSGNVSENLIQKVFVPLFFNMMFDVKDGKGEHLRNAFSDTLACVSGQMQWDTYYRLLMRCFKEMHSKPDKQKFLLRLICSILDMFHFSKVDSNCVPNGDGSNVLNSDTSKTRSNAMFWNNCSKSCIPAEIQETLQKSVLPQILKLLNSDSERINVNISLAALKLLKLLSVDSMEVHLPNLMHRIANFLRNRLESVRHEAMAALVVILKELGLEYLHFVVKVLNATLKRGYELHVLGYTLNFILSKCLVCPMVGSLDYCLEDLLLIVEKDILGDVAEEKEVDKIASKMKETRNRMSFETLKLISQNVSFGTNALRLLSPVRGHLQKHLSAKTKVKLGKMLDHIALGIKWNPSASQKDIFVFVYGLIEDGGIVEDVSSKGKTAVIAKSNRKMNESCNKTVESVGHGLLNSHLITVFGLGVLHNCLKSMKIDKEDRELLSMLDPFIRLLGGCLNSKYEDVLAATFKCLIPIIRLPLPSIGLYADKIKILLLDIVQKSPNANSLLVQSCLKLLTVLLTRISLSNDQLHMLIQFPLFIDLQTNPSFVVLSLLKQMVARKFEVPELYDVVFKVAELMVTSQSEPIRKKSSHILLKFLLDYPLSEKCSLQHLNFLLTNLSYKHASGRESVLEMLNAIINKFPPRVLDTRAQNIFAHLVLALANEQDSRVQTMIDTVLKLLISRSSQNALYQFLEYGYSWYTGENQHLWGAAAQVIGLLVEVLNEDFRGRIHAILQIVKCILESSHVVAKEEHEISNNVAIPLWHEAYHSLALFKKMLLRFPELYIDESLQELWGSICKFLLHPHIKLRNISSHLVALYFTKAAEAREINGEKSHFGSFYLLRPGRLFKMAVSFCSQLESQSIDDATSNLITQNIVYAICALHDFAKKRKNMQLHEYWSALDLDEQSCYLDAFMLLGSKKIRNSFLLISTNVKNGLESMDSAKQSHLEDLQSLLVKSLIRKLSKIAFLKEDNQMMVVFKCFRMITSQIGSEGCHDYAINIVEPLYKVCEGFAGKVISDEVKHSAQEVCDIVRNLLGVERFIQVYNMVSKKLREKRERRRQEDKLIAITDPTRSAKRKLRISAKHRAHKKRKIMGMKMERWRR